MREHCKYDLFIYEGRKYLVNWFPTKSTVCGVAFKMESGQQNWVKVPVSQVTWAAVHYMREIEEIFETLEV